MSCWGRLWTDRLHIGGGGNGPLFLCGNRSSSREVFSSCLRRESSFSIPKFLGWVGAVLCAFSDAALLPECVQPDLFAGDSSPGVMSWCDSVSIDIPVRKRLGVRDSNLVGLKVGGASDTDDKGVFNCLLETPLCFSGRASIEVSILRER